MMFEITWRRSARDSFLNAVSRLRNLATCASLSSLLLSVSFPGRFDGDGGAVGRQCGDEWRTRKMAPTRVILMSCGSYNPPTNMHLRMFGTYILICLHSSGITFYRAVNTVMSCSIIIHDVTLLPCMKFVYYFLHDNTVFISVNFSLYIFC